MAWRGSELRFLYCEKWNKERFATIWEKLESMIALRSLRARIFLLTLVIGLVPCIAMRHGIVSNYEDLAVEQRTTVVQNQLMILANHLISNNYLSSHGVREDTGNSREVINAELEMLSNLYEGRVMIINKNFKVEKIPTASVKERPSFPRRSSNVFRGKTFPIMTRSTVT